MTGERQKVNLCCVDGPVKRFLFITAVNVKPFQLWTVCVESRPVGLHNDRDIDCAFWAYFEGCGHGLH